jgi:hypothetical protein
MSKDKKVEKNLQFLDITSNLVLTYLVLKLIIFPVIQTGINIIPNLINEEKIVIENIKIPDLTFADITLLVIIFLFQPQAAKILETLDLSPQGLKAKFRDLEDKVDQTKQEIDEFQQQQIDLLTKEQKELDNLQRFMYRLLLTPKEIEKLKGLKEHSENNTLFKFYVNREAASELRRLRDSQFIKIKPPYRYVGDLEKASNYAKTEQDFIDLNEYCELTESGKDFLSKLEKITNQNDQDISSTETAESQE